MKDLLIFAGILTTTIGLCELLFPQFVQRIENFIKSAFKLDSLHIGFRQVTSALLILTGVVLLFLAFVPISQ